MEEKGKCSKRIRELIAGMSVLVAIAIAITPLVIVPVIATAQPVEVAVNATEYVEEGATFFVTIDVDNVTEFSYAQFDLSFDHDVIDVSDVMDGEISGEEVPIYMWDPRDADTVGVLIMMSIGECVSGSGYLAEIEFDVIGDEGKESKLDISNVELGNISGKEIPSNCHGAEIRIGEEEEEEEEEEEAGEEVIPGSPNITAWKPAEAVVTNAVGEPRTFNITVNQIADISWQINGTEVQTNGSVTEAVYTNASAVIGTWNVSAIATNTTTGLSDMHAWIWSVTLTPAATATPTPTLAPGVTSAPEDETEAEGTPTPTLAPRGTPTPTTPTTPTATPKPEEPGFEAVFAIVGLVAIAYILLRKR